MKTVKGNLITLAQNGMFDVIIHGCNCMSVMDAGIAKSVKENFSEAHEADLKTRKGCLAKLGQCSYGAHSLLNGKQLFIVNAYTQYDWAGDGILVDYDAVQSCMKWVKQNFTGKKIGIPKIGAGLARGDWNKISKIITNELKGEDVTLVVKN